MSVSKQCQKCIDLGVPTVPTAEAESESKASAILAQHDLAAGHTKSEKKIPFEFVCSNKGHIVIAKTAEERDKLVLQHIKECDV